MVVKASTENSLERMIIYLGADLGLRKVEIKRQKMGDIDLRKRTLDVLHKGRCGGKPGRNPIHELTPLIYGEYMDWRQKQILDVKQGNPDAKDPGTLIIEIDRDKVRPASDYYQEDSHRRLQTLWDILS
jgi:integrase